MSEWQSSLTVVRVERVPRRKEYLVRLSDDTVLRVLEQHLSQFSLGEGVHLDDNTVTEIKSSYEHSKARESALRLLKVRPRTAEELRRALKRRAFPQKVADRVIDDLKEAGLVDDRVFTRLWIKEKLGRGGSGRRLISQQLYEKGIDRTTVEEEIALNYADGKEIELAREAAVKRLARVKGLPSDLKKRRVYRYLISHGFESGIASEAAEFALQSLRVERDR
jgi:regulatory protein